MNAERISDQPKFWIAAGVGFAGVVFSFVLALSIFHGHALAEKLKGHRDELERLASKHFGMPRAGVSKHTFAHIFGHSATKFLPAFVYLAWVAITLAVILKFDDHFASTRNSVLLWPTGEPIPLATAGLSAVPPSPPFAIGAWRFEQRVDGCPGPERTRKLADEWLKLVVRRWESRRAASEADVVILVGGADRLQLGASMSQRFDANVGLARQRAETVKTRLLEATAKLEKKHRLTPERILVLVNGPSPNVIGRDRKAGTSTCADPELSRDRIVQV